MPAQPFDRNSLKAKLINWLQLASYNGYTELYFKSGVIIPKNSEYGLVTAAGSTLYDESNWTKRTHDILDTFVTNQGQGLDPALRIHAYGSAASSPVRSDLEYTYERYLANAIDVDKMINASGFGDWYQSHYISTVDPLQTAPTPMFLYHPASQMWTPQDAVIRYHGLLSLTDGYIPDLVMPGSLIAVPPGSADYLTYMHAKNNLEFEAMKYFESKNGDMDEYATKILIADPSKKKRDLDKQYLLARSTFIGNTMQAWRIGTLLSPAPLRQFNDQATKSTREKIDPYYIVDSAMPTAGALQHATQYAIQTVNEIGSWKEINDVGPAELPYVDKDSVPQLLKKAQSPYAPWYETEYNTLNLIVNTTNTDQQLIEEFYESLIPIHLNKPMQVVATLRPPTDAEEVSARKERLTRVRDSVLGTEEEAKLRIRQSLVGTNSGEASPLARYTMRFANDGGDQIGSILPSVRQATVAYLLKFFDKIGAPKLNKKANEEILDALAEKVFIIDRFVNLRGELCFHTVIHRRYLDVIPRNTHRMDLYEKSYGEGSYYGEYYEQQIPLNTFAEKLTAFDGALKSIQARLDPEDLDDSSKGFELYGYGAPTPSLYERFEEFLWGDGRIGALVNFLNANADKNTPVKMEDLLERSGSTLVFIYDQAYSLKGLYVIVSDGTETKKFPLKLGFDKFAHDEAVSAQNISFISNMDDIIEDEKAPKKKTAKEMINKYVLIPPKFKIKKAKEMAPGVKTRAELLKESRYLDDPDVQKEVYEATKKKRHFAGTAEFASLERTATRIKEISDAYADFVARYGLAELTRELQRCLVELLGLTWSCETQLQMALDALGAEKLRQTVLVPAFQLGGIGAQAIGDLATQQGAKTAETLKSVKIARQRTYVDALSKIDNDYTTLTSAELSAEFDAAARSKTGLQELEKQSQYNRELEDSVTAGADYIKELSKQVDLEKICKNLGDYLLQLVQFLTNPELQDDDISYKLPKSNPKMVRPRSEEAKKRDLYEEAIIAMNEAWQKAKHALLAQMLQATLKMLHAVCQQLRRDLAGGSTVSEPPPVSREELAGLFGSVGPKLPLATEEDISAEDFLNQLSALIDLISQLLTPSQLCALLEGGASQEVLQMILDEARKNPALTTLFRDIASVRDVFREIGSTIDPEYCGSVLAVTDEQLADLCNLPPDAIPDDLRDALQDALDQFAKLPVGPVPPGIGNPCDPIVESERDPNDPPPIEPVKPLMDWKAIPAIVAANDMAIDIFYEDAKSRFDSVVPKTFANTIETSTEEIEVKIPLSAQDEQTIQTIVNSVATGRGQEPGDNDFSYAARVHIAEKLKGIKNAPGFKRFVTEVFRPTELDLNGRIGIREDEGHIAGRPLWASWYYYYYLGAEPQRNSTPLLLPDALFPVQENFTSDDVAAFEIKYIRDAQVKQRPLNRTLDLLELGADIDSGADFWRPNSVFVTFVAAEGEPQNYNTFLSTRAPGTSFELKYPGTSEVKNLSEQFKSVAYTADVETVAGEHVVDLPFDQEILIDTTTEVVHRHPAFKPGATEQFGLSFSIEPKLEIVDLFDSDVNIKDNFILDYEKRTNVSQPGMNEDPSVIAAGISDVRNYTIEYYDFVETPYVYPASLSITKSVAFFDYMIENLESKGVELPQEGPEGLRSDKFERNCREEYSNLCASFTTQVIEGMSTQAVFQDASELTDIEFVPVSFDRLQRRRGFIRKRAPGYNDEGLPNQEYVELPDTSPHGDLLGLSVLKNKVKDEFSKNPVCDPVGDPAADKDLSPLAKASITGVVYLFMRIYTLEFLLKLYPLVARYELLDIFKSNAVPIYIAQKMKMELSRDKGFYCDFVQTVKKIMRDRKNRGEQSLRIDPIGGQPIQISSLDDMLVFMLKEQVPSLVGEFDYIMGSEVKALRDNGTPVPEGWSVFEDPSTKTKAQDLFLTSGDKLLNVPHSRVVEEGGAFNFGAGPDTPTEAATWYTPNARKHGGFFFQKYVRVTDKASPNNASLSRTLQNRGAWRISNEDLRSTTVHPGSPAIWGTLLEKLPHPDLHGVVNYVKWNAFWKELALPALGNSPGIVSSYFDRLALGVRLVYMPPAPFTHGDDRGTFSDPNSLAKMWEETGVTVPSDNEKAYEIYEYALTNPRYGMATQVNILPVFEMEHVLTDSEYTLQISLDEWGDGTAANTIFEDLKNQIQDSDRYKILSQQIIPTDRLYGAAFLGTDLITVTQYRETADSFEPVKKALKSLFYVLLDDQQINRCKDTDLLDALYGLDWSKLLGDWGIDLSKAIIDTIISILAGGLNVLGSDLVGGIMMMLLKLLFCPVIPTSKDSELLGGIGEKIKDEWGCFNLNIPDFAWPDYIKPDPGSKTACPTGQLAQTDREQCPDPDRYGGVYLNEPWDEILLPPVELPATLEPNAPMVSYRTRSDLDEAKAALEASAAEEAEE